MSGKSDFENERASLRKKTKKKVLKITSVIVVAVLIVSSLPQIMLLITAPSPPPPPLEPRGNSGYEEFYQYAGGMVNTANGNLYLTYKDISIKARGFNIELIRAYNLQVRSMAYQQNPLGAGWTCNYFIRLEENLDTNNVTLTEGDGSVHEYGCLDGTNYVTPAGKHGRLNKYSDGEGTTFVLRFLDGSRYNFDSSGILQNITDKNGNILKFTYTNGKLTKVEEDLSPSVVQNVYLNFSYYGDKIVNITDYTGRKITYDYNGDYLMNVTDTTGNTTRYSYTSVGEIEGNILISIIDKVNHRLNFSYEVDQSNNSHRVMRIYTSMWNSSSNSSYNSFKIYEFRYYELSGIFAYNDTFARTEIIDARDYTTKVYMNYHGNPLKIEDPTGNYTQMKWDVDFNVIERTDKNLNLWLYEYFKYSEGGGDYQNKTYGLPNNITDPNGYSIKNEYNFTNNADEYVAFLKSVTNKRGYKTIYKNDSNYNLIEIEDAKGNKSYMTYDSFGHMLSYKDFRGFTTNYSYDAHGNLLNVTDPGGNVTKYGYDNLSRLKNVTDARGYVTSYEYDDLDRVVKITDALGNSTLRSYDKQGFMLSVKNPNGYYTNYSYNYTVGRIEKIIDATGNETIYSYYKNGNLKSVTNSRGYSTSYEYDSLNRLTKITDARGNYTTYTYDANSNLKSLTNRRGYTTTYQYDNLNRKINETDALGNSTEYTYDENGNKKTVKNSRGYTTTYYYDELDRLIKIKDATSNNVSSNYDATNNIINRTDANDESNLYNYDALGQLIKSIYPSNDYSHIDYDVIGNIMNRTNTGNKTTKYQYDALGRITSIIDPIGNSTYAEYDAVGNIINITNVNGYKITFGYDELNRIRKIIFPSGNQTQLSYDEVGNLIERINANRIITKYEYDELNRLSKIIYPSNNVTVKYNEEGSVIKIVNNYKFGETLYYTYDALERVISIKVDYGPFNKTINYTYDEVGNRKTMTNPEGGIFTYNYDPIGRLINITDPWSNITLLQYKGGRIMRIDYPNNIYTNYTYNTEDNVRNIITRNSNGDILLNCSYKYNKCGHITEMIENSENYTFYNSSAMNKLLNVTYPNGELYQYCYDGLGNRLNETEKQNTTNYTYDCDNRLIKVGSTTYSYDNNSNLISKTNGSNTTYYKYDHENRLIEAKLSSTNITYSYSAKGELLCRNSSNQGEKYYLYDSNKVLMEFDKNGSTIAYYNYLFTPKEIKMIMMKKGNTTLYYHQDLSHSIKIMTDSNENIVNFYQYDAFGEITYETENVENEFKYLGYIYDDETEIYINPRNPGWFYDPSKDWDTDITREYYPTFPWLWDYLESLPKGAIDWEEVSKIKDQINHERERTNPPFEIPDSDGRLHIGNLWCIDGDSHAHMDGLKQEEIPIEGPWDSYRDYYNYFVIPDGNDEIHPYVDYGILDTRKPWKDELVFDVSCFFRIKVARYQLGVEGKWSNYDEKTYKIYGDNPETIDWDPDTPLYVHVPVDDVTSSEKESEYAQFWVEVQVACETIAYRNGKRENTWYTYDDGVGIIWAADAGYFIIGP